MVQFFWNEKAISKERNIENCGFINFEVNEHQYIIRVSFGGLKIRH